MPLQTNTQTLKDLEALKDLAPKLDPGEVHRLADNILLGSVPHAVREKYLEVKKSTYAWWFE